MKRKLPIILLCVLAVIAVSVVLYRQARLRSIPATAWLCLQQSSEMILYSIDPDHQDPDAAVGKRFHDYRILGETRVAAQIDRAAVHSSIRRATMAWLGDIMACFNPRHGVRVTHDGTTYDFLICFECQAMVLFSGEQRIASTGICGSPAKLNALLQAANVTLAPSHGAH